MPEEKDLKGEGKPAADAEVPGEEGAAGDGAEGDSKGEEGAEKPKLEGEEALTPEEEALLGEVSGDEETDGNDGDDGESTLTEDEKALLEKASPKVQKRFDAQTAKIKELEAQVKALAEKSGEPEKKGGKTIAEYSEDELYALKTERPEYNKYVEKELMRREVARQLGETKSTQSLEEKVVEAETTALSRYPDLANKNSEIFKLAATIYKTKGYVSIPDGSLVAADQAAAILRKKGKMFKQTESQRLAEIKKTGMTGAARSTAGVGGSSSKRLDELEAKAMDTRPGSPEWKEVMREKRRLDSMKAKAGAQK